MRRDFNQYIASIKVQNAATTCRQKYFVLKAYRKYLAVNRIRYKKITKTQLEKYLLQMKCSQEVRCQRLFIIKDFYEPPLFNKPEVFSELVSKIRANKRL